MKDKAVGHTKVGNWFTVCCLKCLVIVCIHFLCYYSCHIKFCRPIILCLLNYITETYQVTKGHKQFLWGLHIGQPQSRWSRP
jgi:hypothetical protein